MGHKPDQPQFAGIGDMDVVSDCTVLYCIVLYCTVLYCTVLCCAVLYYYNDPGNLVAFLTIPQFESSTNDLHTMIRNSHSPHLSLCSAIFLQLFS